MTPKRIYEANPHGQFCANREKRQNSKNPNPLGDLCLRELSFVDGLFTCPVHKTDIFDKNLGFTIKNLHNYVK